MMMMMMKWALRWPSLLQQPTVAGPWFSYTYCGHRWTGRSYICICCSDTWMEVQSVGCCCPRRCFHFTWIDTLLLLCEFLFSSPCCKPPKQMIYDGGGPVAAAITVCFFSSIFCDSWGSLRTDPGFHRRKKTRPLLSDDSVGESSRRIKVGSIFLRPKWYCLLHFLVLLGLPVSVTTAERPPHNSNRAHANSNGYRFSVWINSCAHAHGREMYMKHSSFSIGRTSSRDYDYFLRFNVEKTDGKFAGGLTDWEKQKIASRTFINRNGHPFESALNRTITNGRKRLSWRS